MADAARPQVTTKRLPLSSQQREWLERAWAAVDRERLATLIADLVNIPSPTGSEGACAQYAVDDMRRHGIQAQYQQMTENRGNAVGWLRGKGGGASLLLYGHFDHYITGDADDRLVTGAIDHPSFHSKAVRTGNVIRGAGSGNPKAGSVACMLAAQAVAAANVPLLGDVAVGLVSGGIHKVQIGDAGRPYVDPKYQGFGSGCEYMLRHGMRTDFCVSSKPGYTVVWEEPGVIWIKLTLKGVVGYAGRRGVYKRPIEGAAVLIPRLVDWFEAYADRHSTGQAGAPGHIGAIEGGWPFKPDFSPAVCNLYLDIRVSPRSDVRDILAEFAEFIDSFKAANPAMDIEWKPFALMPGTSSDPNGWIVQSTMRAWEAVEGQPHQVRTGMSGMTDAALLRSAGIPTARLGGQLSTGADPSMGFLGGEGADLDVMMRVIKCYIHAIIDTCTRPREEVVEA